MSATFGVGDRVATTVYMIGGRAAAVSGTVLAVSISRKDSSRVVGYVVDASSDGYGELFVEAGKALAIS